MKIKDFFSYDRELASYVEENGRKVTLGALATPLFLELALRSMMNTVNTLILSRYTETAAGAIGTAGTLLNFLMMLFSTMGCKMKLGT